MSDDKPSIAELQQYAALVADPKLDPETFTICSDEIHAAAPVLLEIAAAALTVEETGRAYRDSGWLSEDNPLFKSHAAAHRAFNAALSKVRP